MQEYGITTVIIRGLMMSVLCCCLFRTA